MSFGYFSNTFTSFTLTCIFDLLISIPLSISLNLLKRISFFLHLIMLLNSFTIGVASSQFSSHLALLEIFYSIFNQKPSLVIRHFFILHLIARHPALWQFFNFFSEKMQESFSKQDFSFNSKQFFSNLGWKVHQIAAELTTNELLDSIEITPNFFCLLVWNLERAIFLVAFFKTQYNLNITWGSDDITVSNNKYINTHPKIHLCNWESYISSSKQF